MRNTVVLILAVLNFLTCHSLMGQDYESFPTHDSSPKWYVGEYYFMSSLTREFQYIGVDTICGRLYNEIEIDNYSQNVYVRVDGERVYGRRSTNCLDKEYLLYDFSIEPGDSVFVGSSVIYPIGGGADTALFKVVEVDSVSIENGRTKRIKLLYDRCNQNNFYDTAYWIRGVGSLRHPFESFICLCDICEVEAVLRCMFLNGQLKYQGPFDCSTIVSTTNTNTGEVEVFPSIVNRTVTIKTQSHIERVNMYTMNGVELSIDVERVDKETTLITLLNGDYSGLMLLAIGSNVALNTFKLVKQ